jgi:hypothetical protein
MHSAMALSFQDAAENLLYFGHAQASTEYCERRGVAVRPAYDAWQQRNAGLYRETIDTMRAHAAKGGLTGPEQESMLAEAMANQRRLSWDHITRKGVACSDFASMLAMYSALLKR